MEWRLREDQDGKNAQSLLQMWWNLWSIARYLNQELDLLKYSRACLLTAYVTQVNLIKSSENFELYILYMSGVDPSTVHFFDEGLVVKTTPRAAVHVNRCLRKSSTVHPYTRSWSGCLGYLWEQEPLSSLALVIPWNRLLGFVPVFKVSWQYFKHRF